jgi:hypothetical protein
MSGPALGEASASRAVQASIHLEIAELCDSDLSYAARHAEEGLALARQAADPGLTGRALVQKMCLDFLTGRGFTVHLSKAVTSHTKVAWFIVN